MSKVGVRLKINVSMIEKARLFKGNKGMYLDATVFIDPDNQDQYGNNGMITQDVSKEEREQNVRGPILGNVQVFYRENQSAPQHGPATSSTSTVNPTNSAQAPGFDDFEGDNLPF